MKEIFIERQNEMLRIAIKENNNIVDCVFEEEERKTHPGEIFKGIVKNIIPGIKSAFVDIGMKQNAYLYLDGKYEKKGIKKGDELIVEVVKEELGDKGAKITTAFTIPGRYCVLLTDNNNLSFSSKIRDEEFITRIEMELKKPKEIGLKIRTSAEAVEVNSINEEIDELYAQYKKILNRAAYSNKPGVLFSDGGAVSRVLRDFVDLETEKIIVNHKEDFQIIDEFINEKEDITAKVILHHEDMGLFESYGIEKEILKLRNRRVNLPCGGYIIIDKTEAMNVIDVNTGKNAADNLLESNAYKTNMEAAQMAARHIRLRNLSGITVIDFIEMKEIHHKIGVENMLRKCFYSDKNNTTVYPLTELNLAQITRRRRGKNISEFIEEKCDECKGKGYILKFSYLCVLIKNEISRLCRDTFTDNILLEISEFYKRFIDEDIHGFIERIGMSEKQLYLKYEEHVECYRAEPLIFKNQLENMQQFKIN